MCGKYNLLVKVNKDCPEIDRYCVKYGNYFDLERKNTSELRSSEDNLLPTDQLFLGECVYARFLLAVVSSAVDGFWGG